MQILRVAPFFMGLSLVLPGCRPARPPSAAGTPPAVSAATLLVEGLAGKHATDAGGRAEAEIKAISEQHETTLTEIMGE